MKKIVFYVLRVFLVFSIYWLVKSGINVYPDLFDVHGWELISRVHSPLPFTNIASDGENKILWMQSEYESLYKIDMTDINNSQEVTFGPMLIRKMCVGTDVVFLAGVEDSYFVQKDSLEVEDKFLFPDSFTLDCLVDDNQNIIIFSTYWYGVYEEQSWQYVDGLSWKDERLEIEKIIGPFEGKLLLISADNRLFSFSVFADDLSYIGKFPIEITNYMRGGIASDEILWLSSVDGDYYSWSLPFEDHNLIPDIETKSDQNLTLGVFVEQGGRTWIVREEDIVVRIGKDKFVSIKKPFRVEYINSVYIDENENSIYVSTDNGVYRSNFENLSTSNGLEN